MPKSAVSNEKSTRSSNRKNSQPTPYQCVVGKWESDNPTFDLRALRPEIAVAVMTQHVLARHFLGQIFVRGDTAAKFARKHGINPSNLWYFFNGHRLVRFSTIAALYEALPEEAWPDMAEVKEKVGIIRERSENWVSEQN